MGTAKKPKKNKATNTPRKHVQKTPMRVAPRLEGEVKNAGIKEKKKEKKK